MPDLGGTIRVDDLPESTGPGEPVPAGAYLCIVRASDVRQTRNNDGTFIEIEYEIVEGPFARRRLWQMINFINPSQKAQEIGQGELRRLMAACGIEQAERTEDFHGKTVLVTTIVREDEYGKKNRVTNTRAPQGGHAMRAPETAPAAERPAPARSGSSPPWMGGRGKEEPPF